MSAANFNRVARAYRWAEYLTFGRALERCRFHHLPALGQCGTALVLGDGDGRFLSRLLRQNPALTADVVDSSTAMLSLLHRRVGRNPSILLHHADALSFLPMGEYDLVATHFFLDCFTDFELESLIRRISGRTRTGTLWLVSEFQIPTQPILRLPARILVRSLYFAFRLLTGLRITHLPDHAAALAAAGFERISQNPSLSGLLISELWRRT